MRHTTSGFTLIELLIVVVIIGILTTIVVPKLAATKEQAYVSEMKSDLRNIAIAQEVYSADNGVYYSGPVPAGALLYQPSPTVTITVLNVTAAGWGAVASAPGLTARICAFYQGTGGPIAPATLPGHVTCT
jgi:type IV pilus assembly protein PilA